MSNLKPTASGTLKATPLASLLVYALDKNMNGTMVFESSAGGRSAVHFVDGAPAKAKTTDPVIHLGRLLLELGAIDDATLNSTLSRCAKERRLHGQILLEEGVIDQADLEDALREQTMRKVLWLFGLPPDSVYGFYDGKNLLEKFGAPDPLPVEPLALIWRGVRAHDDPTRLDQTVARVARRELRLHPQAQLSRFCFSSREWAVLDLIRARSHTVEALLAAGVEEELTIKRLLYVLALTRSLDLGAGTLPVGGSRTASDSRKTSPRDSNVPSSSRSAATTAPRPAAGERRPNPLPPLASPTNADAARVSDSSPPSAATQSRTLPSRVPEASPQRRPPQVEVRSSPHAAAPPPSSGRAVTSPPEGAQADPAMVKEILERAEKSAAQNYYEVLGVERAATAPQISAAFFTLAKKWHPDRLGPQYADVREQALSMFARMNEAHQVLTDETRRAEYEEILATGGGTTEDQEAVNRVVSAINEYQKAEILYKKQKLEAAELCARRAMEDDPEQADYVAMYASIAAERRGNGRMDDLIALLDRAIAREPKSERSRFARAQIYKRLGRMDMAIKDFRWVSEQNPKNLDAVREIRLHNMRHGGPNSTPRSEPRPSEKPPTGLFGKLFKR